MLPCLSSQKIASIETDIFWGNCKSGLWRVRGAFQMYFILHILTLRIWQHFTDHIERVVGFRFVNKVKTNHHQQRDSRRSSHLTRYKSKKYIIHRSAEINARFSLIIIVNISTFIHFFQLCPNPKVIKTKVFIPFLN